MTAKKYTVLRPFDRQDPEDPGSKPVHFEPGAVYDGPDVELYLAWPDDGGALVTGVSPPADSKASPPADSKGAE